ncbi:hypothetical protein GN956_G18641 [Arapaima gigas]
MKHFTKVVRGRHRPRLQRRDGTGRKGAETKDEESKISRFHTFLFELEENFTHPFRFGRRKSFWTIFR